MVLIVTDRFIPTPLFIIQLNWMSKNSLTVTSNSESTFSTVQAPLKHQHKTSWLVSKHIFLVDRSSISLHLSSSACLKLTWDGTTPSTPTQAKWIPQPCLWLLSVQTQTDSIQSNKHGQHWVNRHTYLRALVDQQPETLAPVYQGRVIFALDRGGWLSDSSGPTGTVLT